MYNLKDAEWFTYSVSLSRHFKRIGSMFKNGSN